MHNTFKGRWGNHFCPCKPVPKGCPCEISGVYACNVSNHFKSQLSVTHDPWEIEVCSIHLMGIFIWCWIWVATDADCIRGCDGAMVAMVSEDWCGVLFVKGQTSFPSNLAVFVSSRKSPIILKRIESASFAQYFSKICAHPAMPYPQYPLLRSYYRSAFYLREVAFWRWI